MALPSSGLSGVEKNAEMPAWTNSIAESEKGRQGCTIPVVNCMTNDRSCSSMLTYFSFRNAVHNCEVRWPFNLFSERLVFVLMQ